MQELVKLDVHPALVCWISAFLTNQKQAVRVGGTLSDWLTLKGGVHPLHDHDKQNCSWAGVYVIKYVDDTSVVEIIPRNSISLLNYVVSDIHNFAGTYDMKLNPAKCKFPTKYQLAY